MSEREVMVVHTARKFAALFLAMRIVEATWIVVIVAALSVMQHALEFPALGQWHYWTPSTIGYAGLLFVAWYYIGFGYIFISALAHALAWFSLRRFSAYRLALLNVSVFAIHSLAVIIIAFHGRMTEIVIIVWIATITFDAVIPYCVLRNWGWGEVNSHI